MNIVKRRKRVNNIENLWTKQEAANLSYDPDETELDVLGIIGPTSIHSISGSIKSEDLPNVLERGDEIRLLL